MLSLMMPQRQAMTSWAPTDPRWYSMIAPKTMAGVTVNEDKALTCSAVFAATRAIAGTLGRLPFNLYEKAERGWIEVDIDPRAKMFDRQMNLSLPSFTGRALLTTWQVNYGNGIAEIQRDGYGVPFRLHPIHPSRIYPKQDPETQEFYYGVRNNNGPDTDLMPDEVFHVRNWLTDGTGFWGIGVVQMARESIGTALGAERNRANQFGKNQIPNIVVEVPKLMQREDRDNFRKEWREIHSDGGNNVALLTQGATAKPLNVDYQSMQFTELSYFGIEDMSRWYGAPVHMMAHLLKSSQNNIEHLSTEFVEYCLSIYAEPWEQEADIKLLDIMEQDEYDWEFKWNKLTRGDVQARTAYYQSGITLGWLTRNEAREGEGYNPIDGGDDPLVQGAMIPADQAGQQKQTQPSPQPTKPNNQAVNQSTDETRAAWVKATASRMTGVEANVLRKLAEQPATFCVKADERWANIEKTLHDAFSECCPDQEREIVATWVAHSRDAVNILADTENYTTLAAAVDRYCDKLIQDRPQAVVEKWKALL